ncbi:MAG: DUF4143 domain-containing protein, partial [Clostridia bacterium]|nr:DUF4143 domain-containing protein [Clostridia bacterium]
IYEDNVSKYEKSSKLLLSEIFNLIPSELNAQNKRFKYTTIKPGRYTDNVENSFLWLTHAGVAIPVYCVDSPKYPLLMSKSRTLLKLFLSDVGLLSSMYFDDNVQVKILADDADVNFGAIYENVVVQGLKSNGLTPYYYNSHKFGELDLLVEIDDKVIPLEIKSGKNYQKHSALDRVLAVVDFKIDRGYVFSCNGDIRSEDRTVYMPIYMSMFLKKERKDSNAVKLFEVEFSGN